MPSIVGRIASRLPRDPDKERRVLKISLAAVPIALIIGAAGAEIPPLSVLGPLASLAAWVLVIVYVRRLPRLLVAGTVGGGIVGLLALGGGSRLAMRIVALLGGRREVTVEGTMFLLIAGTMVGAVLGVSIAAALRVWPQARRPIGTAVGLLLFAGIMLDSEAFDELMHDGPGGWLNFPMFLAFLMAYGWAAPRFIARVERRIPRWAPGSVRAVEPVGSQS